MALHLFDTTNSRLLITKEYPDATIDATINEAKEVTTYLEHSVGKGTYQEIFFEGVHIAFGDAMFYKKVNLGFESDFETIEMHFALEGTSLVKSGSIGNEISFDAQGHNIIYSKNMNGEIYWQKDRLKVCEINVTPEFFKKFLPQNLPVFDTFRNTIEKGRSSLLCKNNQRISLQMRQVLHDIINCSRQGIFKRMFLEAKVIELLLLQFEQFSDSIQPSSLKKSDIDKMYAVREFILANLDASYSLIDLAHLVGTNDFILKKGFKEIFGTTVFGFWNDAKMEQAKQLLTQHQMTVNEVSQTVGYKNQRHFSAAFKRKFGMVPSSVNKL